MDAFFQGLSALFASGRLDEVSAYLRRSLAQARAMGDNHAAITVLNEMIGYYRSVSSHKEALDAADQAIAEMRRLGYEDTPDFGTTLLNAATACKAAGDAPRALDLYEQTLAIYRRHLAPDDPRLAGLYNNLSAMHMESGAYATAAELLGQSARIMTDNEGETADTATVLSNLALALSHSGRESEAQDILRKAVILFERTDNGGRRPPHYAAALSALAEAAYRTGDYAEAARLFEQAMAHIRGCFGENRDYAITANNCALAHDALGNTEKAGACRERSRAVADRLEAGQHHGRSGRHTTGKDDG